MDSITQAVLGTTVAEAFFRERLGRRALLFGAACGTLPDLDILVGAADPWLDLLSHRGPTHSIVVLPFVALALGAVGKRWGGGTGTWKTWSHCAFWSLVTHPLLDVFTSFGTQLLNPLSTRRFALDGVNIVDPVYTVPLVVATVLAVRARSPTLAIRSQRIARGALSWGCLWLGIGMLNHSVAQGHVERALDRAGFQPIAIRVMPLLLNHVSFRYAARDAQGRIAVGHASVTGGGAQAPVVHTPTRDPAVDIALAHPHGERFAWFADNMLGITTEALADGVTRVHLHDLRYGWMSAPERALWEARIDVNVDGQVIHTERDRRPAQGDPATEWESLQRVVSGAAWAE